MFIIVPIIIIFLLFSYLHLNDVTFIGEMVVYFLILSVVLLSIFIYKKVKNDYKIQQQNTIKQEIATLQMKLLQTTEENIKKSYLHKIEMLHKELRGD